MANKLTNSHKIVVMYGPRQVGKTTLAKEVISDMGMKTLFADGGAANVRSAMSSSDLERLGQFVAGYEILFLDEAQKIPNIGENLKLVHDHFPNLKILATGSSSFDLANKISEPLTGRQIVFTLFPIANLELKSMFNDFELHQQLEPLLIWGAYPETFQLDSPRDKQNYLSQLTTDYLYKDVLELTDIRNSQKIRSLLKMLAFQIGSEVSLSEVGKSLEMSKETVGRYVDLLEKSFVLFRLGGFSRNLRNEVTKMNKFYFYDLGVRNALIDNFNYLADRDDVGKLWENFLIIERLKKNAYKDHLTGSYFWRLHTGVEIDYVEEDSGQIHGFEFKWSNKIPKRPQSWTKAYPKAEFKVINQKNYLEFIS